MNWLGAPSMMEPISIPGTRTSVRGYRRVRALAKSSQCGDGWDSFSCLVRLDSIDSRTHAAICWAFVWHHDVRKSVIRQEAA